MEIKKHFCDYRKSLACQTRIKATIAAYMMLVTVFSSCTRGDKLKNTNKFEKYEVIEIDGCEYIQYASAYGMLHITHKGNCKNDIHDCHIRKLE